MKRGHRWVNDKIRRYLTINVVLVLQCLHCGAVTEIVIAGQTSAAGKMRISRPHVMIAFYIAVGLFQPSLIVLALGLLRLMDGHYHRTQKRRLGARQIIGTVCIEHSTVVFNLEEKILHHTACEFHASIAQ